jgi:hypothetical protein
MVVFELFGHILQGLNSISQHLSQVFTNDNIGFDHASIECHDVLAVLEDLGFPLRLLDDPVHHVGSNILSTVYDFLAPFGSDFFIEDLNVLLALRIQGRKQTHLFLPVRLVSDGVERSHHQYLPMGIQASAS